MSLGGGGEIRGLGGGGGGISQGSPPVWNTGLSIGANNIWEVAPLQPFCMASDVTI